ncbi:GNAT family N-acetyltransferase [Microbacterium sp. H1-D42]|nr:GNAT family N-acetyltransferase [Microbacterium sp. H1-D42]UNK72533.1 GNAT family N-acetyltransferase [Microbacterium sp. H1-D42]
MIAEYLAAYDRQLRGDVELAGAHDTASLGPLRVAVFPGGQGFIGYQHLGGADADGVRGLVDAALAHFASLPGIRSIEWKTRAHDHAPGLHDALIACGFVPEDAESIMIGEASLLVQEVALPDGVTLRRARSDDEVIAMERMHGIVFGHREWHARADEMIRRLAEDESMELWTAVVDDEVVSAGRLEPVVGTEFAGLWGGATLPQWRGRGIYRALTAQRAMAALAGGKTYLQSDSTEFSRPILARAGLVKVSTTTPYVWTSPVC